MVEKAQQASQEPQNDEDSYENVQKNMQNEQWVLNNWEELGAYGQQWAIMIHGLGIVTKAMGG